ncbi:hypothetical protein, partial [Salmonella sp. s51228]|uniref:hypothetical protein n=1 Tax=Salmonella sp. s51228 TaxID=3159652 RepID=UPI00398186CF
NLSFNTNVPLLESKSEPAVKYMHVPDDLKSIDHYFGIYYPKCVDEVKLLVNHGRKNKKIVRCKGSGHSPKDAILSNGINMKLVGKLIDVEKIEEMGEGPNRRAIYKVGGGCHIGKNPWDITSTLENS